MTSAISLRSTPQAYGPIAIALHWLVGLCIFCVFGLGLFMVELPFSPDKLRYYSWHKWAGVTIFMLVVLRLTCRVAWRLQRPAPAAPMGMPLWQVLAARWAHRMLYVLMLAVPLSGWLMSSAKGVPTVYLGQWQLPDLVEKNIDLGTRLQTLHVSLNYFMAAIVVVHAAAAIKHHVIDRDEILARMLPFLKFDKR